MATRQKTAKKTDAKTAQRPTVEDIDGFEETGHDELLDVLHRDKGIVISVHERGTAYRGPRKLKGFEYVVRAAKEQETVYVGAFEDRTAAEAKTIELARRYSDGIGIPEVVQE
jgi:hypothetical protein